MLQIYNYMYINQLMAESENQLTSSERSIASVLG